MGELRVGSLDFEWDDGKSESNLRKHGVLFAEAATVFHDALGLFLPDSVHSVGEDRFVLIGISALRRLLTVVPVERSERPRIISARAATARERREHEQGRLGRRL
jgi:uncharacterized protein